MITDTLQVVYERPHSMTDAITTYCPGCTHGVINRLVAEVMDELDIREKTIGVASVGCSVFAYKNFDCDFAQAPHGRAPAMATGLKRVAPDRVVFTYQGDGDLGSIGMAEIVHAAARGENITVVFVNTGVYGMTGGQMAPTTLPGMKTTSSQLGRETGMMGFPIRISEMLATLDGPAYIVRRAVNDPLGVNRTKKALKTAFKCQLNGLGFAMVEILSSCPINWAMTPQECLSYIKDTMIPYYPLGDYKVVDAVKALGER